MLAASAPARHLGLPNAFRRALYEPRGQKPGHQRCRRNRRGPAPHDLLHVAEYLVEAARADRFGKLVEPIGGAVGESADVRAVLELLERIAKRLRQVGDRLRGATMADRIGEAKAA